ncbi:MAG: ABC transporter substrate-binding protein [Pseudomonadota bacterium]
MKYLPCGRSLARSGLALAAIVALAGAGLAQTIEDRLVIVTSFPRDLTQPFAQAFERRQPGTKVEILNRNTAAAVAYVRETRASPPDLFWASAPDAFEVLKKGQLLQKYAPKAQGIPAKVGTYPIHDPEGFYMGFAASGYGIMYNTRYLAANKLPAPSQWDDLKKPIYFGHVGISAPSRSGTTHLTVETVLQGEGWAKGWATMLEIAGNFASVSDRSFGVPDAVNSGQYGIGIVIDFFGLAAKASGFPVEFVYPKVTTIVPANVGVIAGARHPQAASAFVEFLLSEDGQAILLDPKIRRLPVRPATYDKAPPDYPNPFKDASLGAAVKFDADLSEARYELLNSLYDRLITFRLKELNEAWKTIHAAEAALAKKADAEGQRLIARARALATSVPITDRQAGDPQVAGAFQSGQKDKPVRQAEYEEQWDSFAKRNYAEAKSLAEQAARVAR